MPDFERIKINLDSPMYGSLAHAAGLLKRAVRAESVLAVCQPGPDDAVCFYFDDGRLKSQDQSQRTQRWLDDPHARFWQPIHRLRHREARCLDPNEPADAETCREIVRMLRLPTPGPGRRFLTLSLFAPPTCRMLFIRGNAQPTLTEQDAKDLISLADSATHVIRQGLERQLNHPQTIGSIKPFATHPNIHQLLEQLSKTEHTVLHHLLRRRTERQIAESLGRSPNTIHVHVKNIYRKLHINCRKQLFELNQALPQPDLQPAQEPTLRIRSA